MNNLRRKDHRRGAVQFNGHSLGPTALSARHRTVQAISTPPTTPASTGLPAPKTAASLDLLNFDFCRQPIQSIQSDFNIDCYPSASPTKLDLGLEPYTNWADGPDMREMSTISSISADTFSSTGSIFSSISTEVGDALNVRNGRGRSRGPSPLSRVGRTNSIDNSAPSFVCLAPQCQQAFSSDKDLKSHVKSCHTYLCNWAGCDQPSFSTRDGLIYHVKVQHLVICPSPGCTETSFQSIRLLQSHIAMAHPEDGNDDAKEWELPAKVNSGMETANESSSTKTPATTVASRKRKDREEMYINLLKAKRQCQDRLHNVVEKRARKNAGTPRSAESPTDLIRGRASRRIETTSFPLVFEHAILPFLSQYLPIWIGHRHVITVTRGRSPQMKRICIMAPKAISRARKMIIASHVQDLIPANFSKLVTFVFAQGEINRTVTWARGLGKEHKDDICAARNPFFFRDPCMGDSIGVTGNGVFEDSTATLGPCITVGGGSYWLGNFHPFMEAYQQLAQVQVEHPSFQDRKRCVDEGHDAMAQETSFRLGKLEVTSGLNLKTTRISHDPYWDECDMDKPLIVTDWALIGSQTSQANILRKFPSETQPPTQEPIVSATAAIVPGADVLSSGRTSGYQRGQVCEIPAYVSGAENQTHKATREWFIEEPWPQDDENAWIRGGIGVNGDSGAGVVDMNTNGLIGQVWGRNNYWGPGQRVTYFTPIEDIFDDIQEKCGQQSRPQLPQHRDEANCFPLHPSCRQCFDLRAYLNSSRRSSRMSLQSMIMGTGDGDHDLTSIEAVSELATPRDCHRYSGIEETLASLSGIVSPAGQGNYPGTPLIADMKSPYATELDLGDLYGPEAIASTQARKRRASALAVGPGLERWKRQRNGD
ncbi:DNA polymerase epsilon subunit 1 [Fusarium austroafricanum]|uniref:DNA polymerase epsilon subunit 1 n=1 Tax=Fusarium austroafricanum TaxID=2364996 RepID=A0A8H4NY15_9HYPO|nr:DNA polymerase epsilon subunit 1 [Fusarium austroafricanum]